eukprot:jgi/Botrbrau1/8388/Bobra.0237s0011.2
MTFNTTPTPEEHKICQLHFALKLPVNMIEEWFERKRRETSTYPSSRAFHVLNNTGLPLSISSPSSSIPSGETAVHSRRPCPPASQRDNACLAKKLTTETPFSESSYLSTIRGCFSKGASDPTRQAVLSQSQQTRFMPATTSSPVASPASCLNPNQRLAPSQPLLVQHKDLPTARTHPAPNYRHTNPPQSTTLEAGAQLNDLISLGSAPPILHSGQKRKKTYLAEVHDSTSRDLVSNPFDGSAGSAYHASPRDQQMGAVLGQYMREARLPVNADVPVMMHDPLPGSRSVTGDSCVQSSLLTQGLPSLPNSHQPPAQTPHVDSFGCLDDMVDSDAGRFGEPDLALLSDLLGLKTVITSGGETMYLFEQLTFLDSNIPEDTASPGKKRRTRHQHFWRNSDKFPRQERRYAQSSEVNSASGNGTRVNVKLDIAAEERTNQWTVVLTKSGTLNFINRKIGPLGVRLFRAALNCRRGISQNRVAWSFPGPDD